MLIDHPLCEVIAQHLTYAQAIALRERDALISRAAWPTWFCGVDLNPERIEVRGHPEHYSKPITGEDREASDWYAILVKWREKPKEWHKLTVFGEMPFK